MIIIYKISNTINDKIYIGITKNSIKKRFSYHLYSLYNNNHSNYELQNFYNKYGNVFKISILSYADNISEARRKEKFYVKSNENLCFNYKLTNKAKLSETRKNKISKSVSNYAKNNKEKRSGINNSMVNQNMLDKYKLAKKLLKLGYNKKYIIEKSGLSLSTIDRIKTGDHWSCKEM